MLADRRQEEKKALQAERSEKRAQARARAHARLAECLEEAKVWEGTYDGLLQKLSRDGLLFSDGDKRKLRKALQSAKR